MVDRRLSVAAQNWEGSSNGSMDLLVSPHWTHISIRLLNSSCLLAGALDRSSSSICLEYAWFCTSMFRFMAVRIQFIRCLAWRGKELRCRESLAISSFALMALAPWTLCSRPISCELKVCYYRISYEVVNEFYTMMYQQKVIEFGSNLTDHKRLITWKYVPYKTPFSKAHIK